MLFLPTLLAFVLSASALQHAAEVSPLRHSHQRSGQGTGDSTPASTALTVRVYQPGPYSPRLAGALQAAVTRLLEGAGFSLTLVDCGKRMRCSGPVTNELVLRIIRASHQTRRNVCGDSILGGEGRPGLLMTVYRDCVAEVTNGLHRRAVHTPPKFELLRLTEADVLAPIVIHEIIHLLLPSEVHGSGLWKAVLDVNDWQRAAHGSLRLEPAMASRLREAITTRGSISSTSIRLFTEKR